MPEKPKNKTINPYTMEIIYKDLRELKEICPARKWLPNDILEAYLDYASMYSREYWLILQEEYLRRMEFEIAII